MLHRKCCAKVNVRLLLTLIVVVLAAGVSLVTARQVFRRMHSQRVLAAGQAAFANEDWPAAARNFRDYLAHNPTDVEILKKYGQALLAIRPVTLDIARAAIGAYSQLVKMAPEEDVAYRELAALYEAMKQFESLAQVARTRLQYVPTDCEASLWLARAMISLKKTQEARQTLLSLIRTLESMPEKHEEYVQACLLMSVLVGADRGQSSENAGRSEKPGGLQVVAEGKDANEPEMPLEWLDRAIKYMPHSVEALLSRAQFHRRMAQMASTSEPNRSALLALALQDLEAVDAEGTDDPRIRLLLGTEWMAHDELDRADAELSAMDKLSPSVIAEYFADSNDWSVARFRLASEVATRRGAVADATSMADGILKVLTERRHRVQILPAAVRLYLAVGRFVDANDCLAEYAKIPPAPETPEYSLQLAWLRALVARAGEKPYEVIDILQPAVRIDLLGLAAGDDSCGDLWRVQAQAWRLLVEAYRRTKQPQRAVTALTEYLDSLRRQQVRQEQRNEDTRVVRRLIVEASHQLPRVYAEAGNWDKAFELSQTVASSSPTDLTSRMLCLQAGVNGAVMRRSRESTETLKKLSAELADLRQEHPEVADIRILQATIADYFDRPEEADNELKEAIAQCKEPLRAEMQLARRYQGAGRLDEAMSVCQAACERHPEIAEPWVILSGLYIAREDYDAARRCLKEGLDGVVGPEAKASVSIQLALVDLVHGDPNDGISLLKTLAESDPRQIEARELLLAVRRIREDPATAQKLVDELRQAEGQSGVRWRFHQANLWFSSSDWRARQNDTIALLQYCIDADPKSSPSVLLLAALYERLGDLRRATGICRQALAANPAATDIVRILVDLLERQGRSSEAEQIVRRPGIDPDIVSDWQVYSAIQARDLPRAIRELELRISDDDQDDARVRAASRIRLAVLTYSQTKDAEGALKYLKEAEAIRPDALNITGVRASVLAAAGRAQEAHRILDDYVAAHNGFNAYWLRASQYSQEGDFQHAEQDFRKLTTFTEQGATAYVLLARFYRYQQKLDQAVAALEEGLNTYPADQGLRRSLLRMLMQRGHAADLDRADGVLRGLEEQLPQDPELMMSRALLMLRESTPQAFANAERMLQNVVQLDPTEVDAQLTLIDIALQRGDNKAARDYAIRALASSPRNPMLLSAQARAELELGNLPIAAKLAQGVLQQDPNSIDAVDVFVQAALSSGDSSLLMEARRLTDAAVHGGRTSERLLISRAHVYAALNQPKEAIPELDAYCGSDRGRGRITALVTLADLYRIAGDTAQADRAISQAEQLDASGQIVVHGRTLLLVAQKRFDDLEQISSRYILAKGQDLALLQKAGAVLVSLDPPEVKREGVKLFQQAVTLWPTSADARLGLATGLYLVGDAEAAEKACRELLQQYPDDTRALNNLAWILQDHFQRYDEALELANRGLHLASTDLALLDTKGTILSKMPDRLADARSSFEEILRRSSCDSRRRAATHLQLGRVYVKLEDSAQARQCLERALEIDHKDNVLTPEERSEIDCLIDGLGNHAASPSDDSK